MPVFFYCTRRSAEFNRRVICPLFKVKIALFRTDIRFPADVIFAEIKRRRSHAMQLNKLKKSHAGWISRLTSDASKSILNSGAVAREDQYIEPQLERT